MKLKLNLNQITSGLIIPLLVIGIGLIAYFLLLPKYWVIRADGENLKVKQQDYESRNAQLASMNKLIADLDDKRSDLSVIDDAIPDAPRIPELLANLDNLGRQSGLLVDNIQITTAPTLATLQPGQEINKIQRAEDLKTLTTNLGIMQVDVEIAGQYDALKAFLQNLEQNLRLMDVESLVLKSGAKEADNLSFSLRLNTYYQK